MMRSLYSAVSSLWTHQLRMDIVADNIANVNTPGYKRTRMTFQDVFYQTLRGGSAPSATGRAGTTPQQVGLAATVAGIDVIHTQGATAPTGTNNDVMIQGEGFFIMGDAQIPNEVFFTRVGAFGIDAQGNLANPSNGLYVMDVNKQPIQIDPAASSYNIDSTGEVTYVLDGVVVDAGTIGIAKIANPSGLKRLGQNLYTFDPSADSTQINMASLAPLAPGASGSGTLIPGSLEMSNVDLSQEFSDMIITQRGFQANARVITTSDEMLQELTNLKR